MTRDAFDLPQVVLPDYLPPWEAFLRGIEEGDIDFVCVGDLMLLGYSRQAYYGRRWTNPAVRHARGLVLNTETGAVVALPWPKFFNYGEPVAPDLVLPLPDGEPEVTIKMDGALGIGFPDPEDKDRLRWTTRGSFVGEQAQVAQHIWDRKYAANWARRPHYALTLLAEIIHPSTREVVRYGYEDLVLLSARVNRDGYELSRDALANIGALLGMPLTPNLESTFGAAAAFVAGLDRDTEGVVCRWNLDRCPLCRVGLADCLMCDGHLPFVYRVKLKGEEYLRYHRLKTKCTPQMVSRMWEEGSIEAMLPTLPEEFRAEIEQAVGILDSWQADAAVHIADIYASAPKDCDQKAFALWVQGVTDDRIVRDSLFRMRAARDVDLRKPVAARYRDGLRSSAGPEGLFTF